MKTKILVFILLFITFKLSPINNNFNQIENDDLAVEIKVNKLLQQMTLEEKLGQMNLVKGSPSAKGPYKVKPQDVESIKKGLIGALLFVSGTANVRELQKLAIENTRLKIPLLFGADVVNGFKTIFPIPLAESASWDMQAIELSARTAATEATNAGLTWTYAPMIDIARDPRWGRICEGAGEDPYLGSIIAVARVKGFQGKSLKDKNSILACAKHFAAYGAAQAGRDYNTVDISLRELHETYLRPFEAAVKAGVGTIMTSYNELNGIPTTADDYLLNKTLKSDWKFQGFVVSDLGSVGHLVSHGVAKDKSEAAQLAVNAGCDVDMGSFIYIKEIQKLIDDGKVSQETIDDAVSRILRIKFNLGLFDNPYKNCEIKDDNKLESSSENMSIARDVARKSIVLLNNKNGILPLKTDLKTIAVIGPLSDSKEDASLLSGIKAQVSSNTKVLFAKGCEVEKDSVDQMKEALIIARKADVIVLAIGESNKMSGEDKCRSNINIPGKQEVLAAEIFKLGKPVVVVLMNGRPLTIPWLAKNAPSMLECWQLGSQAGNAIADVIFGKYNPSGKLPVTFPYSVGQIPLYYNHKNTGKPKMKESDRYVSRYLDQVNEPVYPFGFGLSYTSFTYSDIKLNTTKITMNDTLNVSIEVKNTGKYDGEEVIQLYIRDLVGSVTRPVKELKGFQKILIKAGQSKQVDFNITASDLSFFTKDMSFKAEPGDFKIFVGSNSEDCKEASFILY